MILGGLGPVTAGGELFRDEEEDHANADDADNAEHDHDTDVLRGPVRALGDVRESLAGDEGVLDGRHFDEFVW